MWRWAVFPCALALYLVGAIWIPGMVPAGESPAESWRDVVGLAGSYPDAVWTGLAIAGAVGVAAFLLARRFHGGFVALGAAGPWLGWTVGELIGWRANPFRSLEAWMFFVMAVWLAWLAMLWGAGLTWATWYVDRRWLSPRSAATRQESPAPKRTPQVGRFV
ncbi:MAG: hypothetical protein HYT80_12070 [Euryarchaeota archaeon]|nr:hypothetical protein [Euryarchaeota archaeon]